MQHLHHGVSNVTLLLKPALYWSALGLHLSSYSLTLRLVRSLRVKALFSNTELKTRHVSSACINTKQSIIYVEHFQRSCFAGSTELAFWVIDSIEVYVIDRNKRNKHFQITWQIQHWWWWWCGWLWDLRSAHLVKSCETMDNENNGLNLRPRKTSTSLSHQIIVSLSFTIDVLCSRRSIVMFVIMLVLI